MKTQILTCLKQADGYLSGQDLCEQLGVSRTAVWKVMRQLQEEGYTIEAVRNRGYRLADSGDMYNEAELKSAVHTKKAGQSLFFFDEVDSTNNKAKQLAEQGVPDGTLVVAETQCAGKGRRGKQWVSSKGTGIWMSMVLRPEITPDRASMLTLVAALAVTDGIDAVTGLQSQIKWPNDIVIQGKKVCGILTEMSTEMEDINYVVVGIGINVNMREFPEDISAVATSLVIEGSPPVKRADLINAVMQAWERHYEMYLQTSDMTLLVQLYNNRLVNRERQVNVLAPDGAYSGVSHGIDAMGQLLVEKEDKTVVPVMSGEVSVRGIYGYV
ncbi:MAG: biotin--[acetyl-CoA-carboxylase] ligase [Lachnospiraceae bacterium]